MNQFLQYQFLDNSIQQYINVIGIIVLVLIIKKYFSKFITQIIFQSIGKSIDKSRRVDISKVLIKPLGFLILTFITIAAINNLNYPAAFEFKIYRVQFSDILNSFTNLVLIIILIWVLFRLVDFISIILEYKANETETQIDNQLVHFFRDFSKVILVVTSLFLILKFVFNKPIGNLLTGLSIVGAAIALSLKESLENLIASFIIFIDKPFTIGDIVKVNNFTGTIEKIGLRSTRIRTFEKTYISVPNKQMVDSIVDNLSMRLNRKALFQIELSLFTSSHQINKLIEELKKDLPSNEIESLNIFLLETGKNSHVIQIDYLTEPQILIEEYYAIKEKVNFKILLILEKENIELAATNNDIRFKRV